MAVYAVFESLISLGLWSFAIREIGAQRSRAGTIFLHGCLLSLLVTIPAGVGLCVTSLSYSPEVRVAMLIMCVALWPAGVSTYADSVFLAVERASYVGGAMLAEEALLTAAAVTCLWFGFDLSAIVVVVAGARVLGAAVRSLVAIRLAAPTEWRFDWGVMRQFLRHAPVFLTTSLLWTLFWRIDVIMLSWLSTAEQVGLYTAALRIVTTLQEVPKAITVTLFPRFAALYGSSRAEFQQLYVRTGKYLLAFALLACLGVTTIGGYVLTALFSDKFVHAAPILNLAIWGLVPFSITNLFGNMLISSHNQNADMIINGLSLAVIVGLNGWLVPSYGALGAAAANLVAVTAGLAMRAAFSWSTGMLVTPPPRAVAERAG
jgi:O-antigen/teichoic acid export membrane protein